MARRAAAVLAAPPPADAAAIAAGLGLSWLAWSLGAPALPVTDSWGSAATIALVSLPLLGGACVALVAAIRNSILASLAVLAGGLAAAVVGSLGDQVASASLGKAAAGTAAGVLASRALDAAWQFGLVAGLAILVDAWSVFAGPTKEIAEGSPDVLDAIGVALAAPGREQAALIGTTDFLFLGLLAAGTLAYGLRPWLTLPLLIASFSLTVVLATALDRALPALPLLALAFLLPNLGRLRPPIRPRVAEPGP